MYDLIKEGWNQDSNLRNIISEIQEKSGKHPKFSWYGQELRRNGKMVVGNSKDLKSWK